MNIAFETHQSLGADLILPDPSARSRSGNLDSDTVMTQQGSVELARFAFGENRSVTYSWDELSTEHLDALRDLASGVQAHALRDIGGDQMFVVFSQPDDSPVPGLPGAHRVSVTVEIVLGAQPGTVFPPRPARSALRTYGSFTPRWAETGGKLSLFQPVLVTPASGSVNVNPRVPVTVTFSEDIDESTFNDASLRVLDSAGRPAAGGWVVQGRVATFSTPFGFLPGETFTLEINADRHGLRGLNGWWLSRSERHTFTVDARGPVAADSLSFAGFTGVARGLVRESGLNGQSIPSSVYGAPVAQLDLMFDDELLSGAGAVQLSFRDEFSLHEGSVRVLSRELIGRTLRVVCTAGNFGQLVARVRGGTTGLIGKRRGRMNSDAVVTFDMTRESQLYLRQNYPQFKAVSGTVVKDSGVLLQDGVFMPDVGIRRASRDDPMPGFYQSVLIDLTGPTLYRVPDGVTSGSDDGIPPHLKRPGVVASLTFDFDHWLHAHRDGSAAPSVPPVDTNGTLTVSSVTPLTGGRFDVTFNVPLLDAEVPASAVQLAGSGNPAVSAVIRAGTLQVSVGSYRKATFAGTITPGAWLRGERGFMPNPDAAYPFSVTATDGVTGEVSAQALSLLSFTPDGSFDVAPDSQVTLVFSAPVTVPDGAVTAELLDARGVRTPLDVPPVVGGAVVTLAALGEENATVIVTVKGGPDGVRGDQGQLIEETLHRRVIRTRFRTQHQPAPAARPQALSREVLRAAWSFQAGPDVIATPGPWALTGPGAFVPGGNENNAYALRDGAGLTGGADLGAFETYELGFAVAALARVNSAGSAVIDLGATRLALIASGAKPRVDAQFTFLHGGAWRSVSYSWTPDVTSASLFGRWTGLSASFAPSTSELILNLGASTVSARVTTQAAEPRVNTALITGSNVDLSELAVLDSPAARSTMEDYFGTF